MDFKSLVLAFVFNLLTIGIPIGLAIYLALKLSANNIAKTTKPLSVAEDLIKRVEALQNKN